MLTIPLQVISMTRRSERAKFTLNDLIFSPIAEFEWTSGISLFCSRARKLSLPLAVGPITAIFFPDHQMSAPVTRRVKCFPAPGRDARNMNTRNVLTASGNIDLQPLPPPVAARSRDGFGIVAGAWGRLGAFEEACRFGFSRSGPGLRSGVFLRSGIVPAATARNVAPLLMIAAIGGPMKPNAPSKIAMALGTMMMRRFCRTLAMASSLI